MKALLLRPDKARRWRTENGNSTTWHADLRFWRIQLGYRLHLHRHSSSDRWVVQPFAIYDRKWRP